jgi:glucose/arabinose dehydrogenase
MGADLRSDLVLPSLLPSSSTSPTSRRATSRRAPALALALRRAPRVAFTFVLALMPACSSGSPGDSSDAGHDATSPQEAGPMPAGGTFCALPGSVVHRTGGVTTVVPGGAASLPDLTWLQIPEGFCAHHFGVVPNARQIRFAPGGEAFVASPTTGTTGGGTGGLAAIVVVPDDNHDGVADGVDTFLDGLPSTQGLLFVPGFFYYQDGEVIRKLAYARGQRQAPGPGTPAIDVTVHVSPLHWPKALDVADDGTIYVGNGSDQGEVCFGSRPFVGGILRIDGTPDGAEVAKGFRNPIAVRCQRGKNHCFVTELALDYSEPQGGREKLVLVQPGDFGYPCCATTNVPYTDVQAENDAGAPAGTPSCGNITPELAAFHIARTPFGIEFAPSTWPAPWGGRIIVSFHGAAGTWTGANVTALAVDSATGLPQPTTELGLAPGALPPTESMFAAGWDDGKHDHGRPADMAVSSDGRLFLNNDTTGEILWVAPIDLPAGGADAGADASP